MSDYTPKSPLTSARVFDKKSDAELADWLDSDAQAMDGQPGQNNRVAATRAAAERLRRLADHDAKVRAETWDEAIAAVFKWWSTPEEDRGVIVNPYGLHPADRLMEEIEREAGLK